MPPVVRSTNHTPTSTKVKSRDIKKHGALSCKKYSVHICDLSYATLMMDSVSTSETSANIYQTTRCYNPEESNPHTRHRENLKSHVKVVLSELESVHYLYNLVLGGHSFCTDLNKYFISFKYLISYYLWPQTIPTYRSVTQC
jgi:hypothetical protein